MKKTIKSVPHATNLRAIAKYNAINKGDKVAFKYKGKDKEVVELTYREYSENVENLICALKEAGLSGKRVAIIGETCPEWFETYYAVISAGGVAIPLDKELLYDQIKGFLDIAEADVIVMSPAYSQKYEALMAAGVFDNLKKVIRIDDGTEWTVGDEKLVKFYDFIKLGEG